MLGDGVAIVGMGCSRSGALYDSGREDLLVDAGLAAIESAGISPDSIQASWFGCTTTSSVPAYVNYSLKLAYTAMTKVGNEGATGAETLRAAYIAVASGVYDCVLAAGVEKLDDYGHLDFVQRDSLYLGAASVGSEELVWDSRPAVHSAVYLPRYCTACRVSTDTLRQGLSRIVRKNRRHGVQNELAAVRKAVDQADIDAAPMTIWPMTALDTARATDGAAAAIVCSLSTARRLGRPYVVVEGFGAASGGNEGRLRQSYGFDHVPETRLAAQRAFAMAGIADPTREIDHAQVFDLTSAAELLAYEDLGLAPRGGAVESLLSGAFDAEGRLPTNTDGGLLCNGYQPGATGIRQVYEAWVQLTRQAGRRQLPDIRHSLVHTVGGTLGSFTACVQVLGRPEA